MKTKNIFKYMLTMMLLCMGAMPLMAQKNIDKLVKELENRDDISINSVTKRDPKTRKISRVVKTFTFKGGDKIVKQLIDAFEKDEEYAITAIKDMPKGRKEATRVNFTFIFQREDNEKRTYTLNTQANGSVTMTVIINPDGKGNNDWTFIYPNDLNLNNLEALGSFQISDEQKELIDKHFEKIRKQYKDKYGLHISEK